MKVKVSEYRDQISHLERVINYDAHMCVGDQEIQSCVRVAKSVGADLLNMECKTAKIDDIARMERIIDKSSNFITKHTIGD